MAKQKIALFGGSFDPVHQGHLAVATCAQQALNLDQIIFIPCAQSPHKLEHSYTPDKHRIAMLELATQNISWAQVSDYEITAPKPSYSINTIEYFQSSYPQAQLYWIMGMDQWDNIEAWYNYERILDSVTIIIYPREKINKNDSDHHLLMDAHCIYLDQASYLPISSTLIRKDFSSSKALLNAQVFDYALTHQLYL